MTGLLHFTAPARHEAKNFHPHNNCVSRKWKIAYFLFCSKHFYICLFYDIPNSHNSPCSSVLFPRKKVFPPKFTPKGVHEIRFSRLAQTRCGRTFLFLVIMSNRLKRKKTDVRHPWDVPRGCAGSNKSAIPISRMLILGMNAKKVIIDPRGLPALMRKISFQWEGIFSLICKRGSGRKKEDSPHFFDVF